MKKLNLVSLAVFALSTGRIAAQDLEYRYTLVNEAMLYKINLDTPLNIQNQILPQATRGNILTSNLFLSYGSISSSINFSAISDNIHGPDYRLSLRELSLDWSLSDQIDITLGKKILKWGTGYAFNPTGVVEPQRSPSDPSDRLSQNDGRKIVALNIFSGKSSITFVYLNDVRIESGRLWWGTQEFAVRAYTFINGLDLSLVGHYTEGDRLGAGINWSYVIGSDLELHGEFLTNKGSSVVYHPSIAIDNLQQIFTTDPSLQLYDHSNRLFPKFLIGGQYTLENGANLALEYYHNSEGLDRLEWNHWMKFVKFQGDIVQGRIAVLPSLVEPARYNLLWALRTLSTRGTMSDYGFAREFYSIDGWSFEIIEFLNIVDGSAVIVPSVSFKVSNNFFLYIRWTSYTGGAETEFGSLFSNYSCNVGMRFQL